MGSSQRVIISQKPQFMLGSKRNYKEKSHNKINVLGNYVPDWGDQFRCPQCNRRYRLKATLNRHIKFECGKEPQFDCTACHSKFHHRSNLRRHILTIHNYIQP